jgi:hypothetical protein
MGLITYKLNISYSAACVTTPSAIIEEQKHQLLAIMPHGTEAIIVDRLEDNFVNMSIVYILTFSHPLFKDGSRIELDYTRDCWQNENGATIDQANVLTGVRYYDPDGKLMYEPFPKLS